MVLKADSQKLYIQVFDKIRKYIMNNNLVAGDKLPTEQALCEMFGVSRNVLREAVKTLEIMGVIKSAQGIGIVIQEYNLDFLFQQTFYFLVSDSKELIHEILDIRKTLELGFAEKAFHAVSAEQIVKLREITDQMGLKYLKQVAFYDEDVQFHVTLFGPVKNRTLNAILLATWEVDSNFNVEEKVKHLEVYKNHVEMVDALEKRDLDRFMKAIYIHFNEPAYLATKGYT